MNKQLPREWMNSHAFKTNFLKEVQKDQGFVDYLSMQKQERATSMPKKPVKIIKEEPKEKMNETHRTFFSFSQNKTHSLISTGFVTRKTHKKIDKSRKDAEEVIKRLAAKKRPKTVSEGIFLHVKKYDDEVEIKDKRVLAALKEVNNQGPFSANCGSCRYRNMRFYEQLKAEDAIKILTVIKKNQLKNE